MRALYIFFAISIILSSTITAYIMATIVAKWYGVALPCWLSFERKIGRFEARIKLQMEEHVEQLVLKKHEEDWDTLVVHGRDDDFELLRAEVNQLGA